MNVRLLCILFLIGCVPKTEEVTPKNSKGLVEHHQAISPIPITQSIPNRIKPLLSPIQTSIISHLESQINRIEKFEPENAYISYKFNEELMKATEGFIRSQLNIGSSTDSEYYSVNGWVGKVKIQNIREVQVSIEIGNYSVWNGQNYAVAGSLYTFTFFGEQSLSHSVTLVGIRNGDWVRIDADIAKRHTPPLIGYASSNGVGHMYVMRGTVSDGVLKSITKVD